MHTSTSLPGMLTTYRSGLVTVDSGPVDVWMYLEQIRNQSLPASSEHGFCIVRYPYKNTLELSEALEISTSIHGCWIQPKLP